MRYDIFKACKEGDLDTVVALGNSGVDLSISDESGATPLMLAALGGHGEVVSELLLKFNCPLQRNNKNGLTVLHYACAGGSVSLVQTLIREHKADVHARDDTNNTPLNVA